VDSLWIIKHPDKRILIGIIKHLGWLDAIERYIDFKAGIVTSHRILVAKKYLQKENYLNAFGGYGYLDY
jgi:hypothetical protein